MVFDFDHEIELIDPQQMAVIAAMPPEDRVINSMVTSEWVLAWATPLRGAGIREFIERELQ